MIMEQMPETVSKEMDQLRRPDPALLQYIYEQGWFKLFVPEELGGRMTPLPEALEIFEQAAVMDGNLGWLVTIGSGGGMFTAYMQAETAREQFSPVNAVVAGSGAPTGSARPADGGYSVTGEWKYCSGSTYATLFTANCRITGPSGEADEQSPIRSFIFRPDQVEIVPDWNAFGLRATDSHTIRVRDAFVPESHTFSLEEQLGYQEELIYRYPFLPFAEVSFAAMTLGLARHFLEEAAALAERNQAGWEAAAPGRYHRVRERITRMEERLAVERSRFYDAVRASWEELARDGSLPDSTQQLVGRLSKQAARTAAGCAGDLFGYLGMSAIREDAAVNRIWRDLQTASQHGLLVSYEENSLN